MKKYLVSILVSLLSSTSFASVYDDEQQYSTVFKQTSSDKTNIPTKYYYSETTEGFSNSIDYEYFNWYLTEEICTLYRTQNGYSEYLEGLEKIVDGKKDSTLFLDIDDKIVKVNLGSNLKTTSWPNNNQPGFDLNYSFCSTPESKELTKKIFAIEIKEQNQKLQAEKLLSKKSSYIANMSYKPEKDLLEFTMLLEKPGRTLTQQETKNRQMDVTFITSSMFKSYCADFAEKKLNLDLNMRFSISYNDGIQDNILYSNELCKDMVARLK